MHELDGAGGADGTGEPSAGTDVAEPGGGRCAVRVLARWDNWHPAGTPCTV